jgi:hypothetical protein
LTLADGTVAPWVEALGGLFDKNIRPFARLLSWELSHFDRYAAAAPLFEAIHVMHPDDVDAVWPTRAACGAPALARGRGLGLEHAGDGDRRIRRAGRAALSARLARAGLGRAAMRAVISRRPGRARPRAAILRRPRIRRRAVSGLANRRSGCHNDGKVERFRVFKSPETTRRQTMISQGKCPLGRRAQGRQGVVSAHSGAFRNLPFTFGTRFEDKAGPTPRS